MNLLTKTLSISQTRVALIRELEQITKCYESGDFWIGIFNSPFSINVEMGKVNNKITYIKLLNIRTGVPCVLFLNNCIKYLTPVKRCVRCQFLHSIKSKSIDYCLACNKNECNNCSCSSEKINAKVTKHMISTWFDYCDIDNIYFQDFKLTKLFGDSNSLCSCGADLRKPHEECVESLKHFAFDIP